MTLEQGRRASLLLSCVLAATAAYAGAQSPGTRTNPDAKTLADFDARLTDYVELRKRLQRGTPPLAETADPSEIRKAQDMLANRLADARKGAKQGEFFTPEVRQVLQRVMHPELKGPDAARTREAMKEDAPAKGLSLKVNARYPQDAPLPTVPPNMLAALPKLPDDLEYRFVNRDLILRDVQANLILDIFPNAIR